MQLEFKVIPDSFHKSNICHHKKKERKEAFLGSEFILETVNKENGCQLFTTTTTHNNIIFFIKYNKLENSSLAFQISKASIPASNDIIKLGNKKKSSSGWVWLW